MLGFELFDAAMTSTCVALLLFHFSPVVGYVVLGQRATGVDDME